MIEICSNCGLDFEVADNDSPTCPQCTEKIRRRDAAASVASDGLIGTPPQPTEAPKGNRVLRD